MRERRGVRMWRCPHPTPVTGDGDFRSQAELEGASVHLRPRELTLVASVAGSTARAIDE